MARMKHSAGQHWQIHTMVCAFLWLISFPVSGLSQLATANDGGVSIGHIHLFSKDPDAQRRIWVEAFGAQPTRTGTLEMLRLPGVFIIINKSDPTDGSAGSTADHIGFSVRDLNDLKGKLAALNVQMEGPFVAMPDGLRLELLEEKAQTLPVVMHHIHLAAVNGEMLRRWYVKTFGAENGSRRSLPAAMFTGNEVDFLNSAAPTAASPTRGRVIDHIGFEVKDLEAFVKRLQAEGVAVEAPVRNMPNLDLKIAFIVDPVGTRIELTEGLRGK
jgi:catechol 2,3-dioxygenase-like lactoylglutathione lyase family enzyme